MIGELLLAAQRIPWIIAHSESRPKFVDSMNYRRVQMKK
jgi:chorismate-pyruvate lyase